MELSWWGGKGRDWRWDMGRNSGNMGDKGRIRERLTPGPLTHLSLSLRLRSLSLRTLSLRESLEQVMHKGFEQSLYAKGWIFIVFFVKRVHLFIGRGGKEKGHLEEPRDRRGRGIWGCGGTSSSSAGI